MTNEMLIDEIRACSGSITDVALRDGVIWLCENARNERRRADRFFELWQTERDVFRDVKEFAEEKISGLEKERDGLRDRLEQYEAEQLVRVCPGCHAVAPERCAPGCIDNEIERAREEALEFGTRGTSEDEGDW